MERNKNKNEELISKAVNDAIDFKKPIKETKTDMRVLKHIKQPIEIKENSLAMSEDYKNSWSDVQKAMKGKHAERFSAILDALPNREFLKAYLDILEYFVPKKVRTDGSKDKKRDNKLEISISRKKIV